MKLAFGEECVVKLLEWLGPFAERIDVAGSIRRKRPVVSDVDLVVIPRVEAEKDLLGPTGRTRNLTWNEIDRRATVDKWTVIRAGTEIVTWVAKSGQVDLFWATPETWGTVLMLRTGSMQHNVWLAKYAQSVGAKWHPQIGLYKDHRKIAETEEAIYGALGIRFIQPPDRELDRLPFASIVRGPAAGGSVGVLR